jgi:hypothetical protein
MACAVLVWAVGCGGEATPDAGGAADAGPGDSGAADAGLALACGALTCDGYAQHCREALSAPCAARDGGACGAGEEACPLGVNATGCWPAPARSCAPLPDGCTNCVCLINEGPCGAQVQNVTCGGTAQVGLTVQCPP